MSRIKYFIALILAFATVSHAVDAYYRHHQRTSTTALETDLVAREIGIDGSARNSIIAKKANGDLIHVLSKEMDTASLNGVLNVAGQSNLSGAVKMANYTSGRVPYFSTGGLITDASTFTYNGTTLAVNSGTYSGTLGITGALTGTTGTFSGAISSLSPSFTGTMAAANGTYSGTLGVAGASTLGTVSATSGAFSSTLGVTGAQTNAGLTTINSTLTVNTDAASAGSWGLSTITSSSGNGTQSLDNIRDHASNVFRIRMRTAGTPVIGLSIDGGGSVTIPALAGTGTRLTTSTSTGVQGNATTIAGANTWSDAQTFTAAPVLSAATASRLYATNGSKAGTSNAALTINGFTYPDGAGSLASTSAATNGQLLVGSTSSAPVAATLTGTANEITVTNGAGSITLDIPNSPVFTTPNIGAATATSVAATGAVSGVSLATTGGETFTYGDTSFTITVSAGMTTTPTGTAIGTKIGKVVTLFIPNISGTSNANTFTLSGIPPTWTPATIQHVSYAGGTDNGIPQFTGIAYVMTDNTILLGTASGGFGGWTSSGTKATGFSTLGTTITYLVL